MDAKIITGLLLCCCLMASISLSQSASAKLDSRLRLRRQNDETDTDPTADDVQSAGTTVEPNTGETATVILPGGTTLVIPSGTTATIVADDVTGSTEGLTDGAETAATGATEEVTTAGAATEEAGSTVTIVADELETSTIVIVDNGTDIFTSIKPGNGHATDEDTTANDTVTAVTEPSEADGSAATDVTDVSGSVTLLTTPTIDGVDNDGNGTQSNATEGEDATTTTTTAVVPGGGQGPVQLRVVVNPEALPVQRGRTVEFSCTVYGGDANTNVYWIQEQPERRYAVLDNPSESDKQVSASQVTLRARITLDDPSKIGTYTCMAQDASGNSGSAVLTMQEGGSGYYPPGPGQRVAPGPAPGGRYLRIIAPDMTDGDYVEIQCEGAAPEDEGRIQWYFNNQPVADQQPLYPRGKTLHIRPISRAYLGSYRCTVPGGSYSDANSVLTFGDSGAGTGAGVGPVQPTGPVYQQCGVDEATCRNGRCIPRQYLCDGKNDCGDNSDETCGPQGVGGADICQPNEVRCADSSRGRKCVQKFWTCDGDRDCDDGSDEQLNYCQYLPQQQYCKASEFRCSGANGTNGNPVCVPRSFQCDGYTDCPDRSDEIGCVKPTIVSPPDRQVQIAAGETLTLRCTARGAPAPYINWRLNWGHICGDGSDNGRCSITQAFESNDPTLVTCTLTVRNVNANDGGAYSCEALNNQGFIFAIPDAIVNVIIRDGAPRPSTVCSCNGHSSYCAPDGRCQNCQHNTAGYNCEFCAPGYQGNARAGTPYDCQPTTPVATGNCDPSGTYTQRDGRCVCKYNVQGDRCDQCKPSHFYLNPTTPNGCLPCFCSGVSTTCSSTDWRREAVTLPLTNWNAVPKNFATDRYEAGDRIQQRANGRELSLDQNSLGRSANEVLYWKAPRAALGDVVTLYDGNIDVYFTNDGNENQAPSDDEFLWLRGNNIDLVHKLPQNQRFKSNSNATYSVAVNERTFTRKDGTYIDRENILMALSDLDTLLVKINPIGGRKAAVLRGVTFNLASRNGYSDAAPTVESCSCPANYTGTSCEKCAEGYGRPHPLVGIYLGQCWSCRSICNDRSDQCDRETGKCSNCQGNSEGDRCERCRSGYVLDGRINQCVTSDPLRPVTGSGVYIDQKPIGPNAGPLTIVLDGNLPEQRVPLQVLNVQPQSVVWSRADGSGLPAGVYQEGNDLVIRNPSAEQAGNYVCTITHPDGTVERFSIYLDYRPGSSGAGYAPVFSPASPLTINEGESQLIQPPPGYYRVQWTRAGGQPLPSGISQYGNGLQISGARPDHSGTYNCELIQQDGRPITVPYELRVQGSGKPQDVGGPPRITIQPRTINLKEGQRMIVQYAVASQDPITVVWNKLVNGFYQPIPSLFTVEPNRLVLNRATPDAAGTYQVVVRNSHGEDRQELNINVEPRRSRQRGGPQIRLQQTDYQIGQGEVVDIVPNLTGQTGGSVTWSKDGSTNLPDGVTAREDGYLRIEGRGNNVAGQYKIDASNAQGQTSSRTVNVQWKQSQNAQDYYGGNAQDGQRSYIDVRLQPRDAQNLQVGQDVYLDCAIGGSVERPYEYTYTKDGQPLANNVEVHPEGLLVIRNAQASDAGRYRCEVNFPRTPEVGTQESSYDLAFGAGAAPGGGEGAGAGAGAAGYDYGQQAAGVEVTAEPAEATIEQGRTANITCVVKGAQQYTVKWGKYAHDTALPDYVRQEGNSAIISPTNETPSEQMYLQCQVDVPGQAQPYYAYAPVNIRGGDQSSKKKKKRRS